MASIKIMLKSNQCFLFELFICLCHTLYHQSSSSSSPFFQGFATNQGGTRITSYLVGAVQPLCGFPTGFRFPRCLRRTPPRLPTSLLKRWPARRQVSSKRRRRPSRRRRSSSTQPKPSVRACAASKSAAGQSVAQPTMKMQSRAAIITRSTKWATNI